MLRHLRTAALFVLALLPLAAQPGPRVRAGLARTLNLSDDQLASAKAIRAKHADTLRARREALREAQVTLRQACQDPALTAEQLRPLHDKAAAARFDLLLAARAQRLELRALLTPAQREKAAELRGAIQARCQEHRRAFRARPGWEG